MLIAICGPIGSGKTLFMTRCIYREKTRNPTVKVATNYKLVGIDFEFINAQDLFDMKQSLKDTILGIDEFHIFLDSRAFMKPSNQQLTHFILQTRHLGVNLYFTTQDISQVDVRLRKQIDFLAYCSGTHIEGFFKVKMIDYRDVLNVRSNDFIYDATPYYKMYDTTEIIDITHTTSKKIIKNDIPDVDITTFAEPKKEKKKMSDTFIDSSNRCVDKTQKKLQKPKIEKKEIPEQLTKNMPEMVRRRLFEDTIDDKVTIHTNVKPIQPRKVAPLKPKEKTQDEIIADIDKFLASRETK